MILVILNYSLCLFSNLFVNQIINHKENEEEKEDDDSEESESDFEIDAPKPNFPTETIEDYFNRTNELWLTEAANEFPDEKSKKFLKKVAFEICQMFWDKFKDNNKNADIKSSEPVS